MSQPVETTSGPVRRRGFAWGRAPLLILALALAYGAGILLAPYIPATQFEAPLKQALERTLDRTVELSDVRYSLYPSPGLSAKNLVIHDSAAVGIEPLAYVSEIQVSLGWGSLLTGRFKCSSVLLDEASLNIARTEEGGWNVAFFLSQMARGLQRNARAPKLQVRNSRINFRDGLRKSPFFLNAVDLDLDAPASPDGEFSWSYEASPARTDRSAQGFGRFSGAGRWRPGGGNRGILDLDLELERSVISEVAVLLTGRDPGVQGRLSSRAHLSGPPDNIQVRGTVRLGDLQKPSIFGVRGREWSIPYAGVLNLDRQTVTVGTVPPKDDAGLPLSFHLTVEGLFTRIAWQARFLFDGLPAATLLEVATRLGAPVPPGLSVEGTLAGPLDFASTAPAQGSIELHNGALRLAETSPYHIESARFLVDGTRLSLETATLTGTTTGSAEVSADWDIATGAIVVASSIKRASWKDLRAALSVWPDLPLPAGLATCEDGEMDGDLSLERTMAGAERAALAGSLAREGGPETRWAGTLRLANLKCALEGTAEALQIERGLLTITGSAWHLRRAAGQWGSIAWTGEASWQPPAAQPVRFIAAVDTLSALELERVFRPVLGLRASLLERTLAFRKTPLPPWLAGRRWDGRVTAGALTLAEYRFSKLAAHILWTGDSIDVAEVEAGQSGGRILGRASVYLGGSEPRYRLRGVVDALEWEGHGSVDGEFDLSAAGFGDDLRDSIRCTGQLNSRRLELSGETLEQATLGFDYDASRTDQRLRLSGIEAQQGETSWLGSGGSSGDGRWRADLAAGSRNLSFSGTFLPFRLDSEGGNQLHER
jgi:hypothetical protein